MPSFDKKLSGQVYEFGPYRLDVAERQLLRAGEPVRLTPKVFDLLLALVENGGRLMAKEELMERVWPDSYVEEGNINRNISTLRRALNGDGAEFIETVPKRGYRFIAPVTLLENTDEIVLQRRVQTRLITSEEVIEAELAAVTLPPNSTQVEHSRFPPRLSFKWKALLLTGLLLALVGMGLWWRQREEVEPIKRLAILPFKFLGASVEDEYLGPGITDALITKLSHLRQVTVLPTSAVLPFQHEGRDVVAAGRQLKVAAILDGRVQKDAENLRVTAQLVRVADGVLLWSGEFTGRAGELMSLQDALSTQITRALAVRLTSQEQERLTRHYTENTTAHQLYLKGRYLFEKQSPESFHKALECFNQALTLDPAYILPYDGLARCYMNLAMANNLPPAEGWPKAAAVATKALELDDASPVGHTALAGARMYYHWDWAGAEREYRRARNLEPALLGVYQGYGTYLAVLGRFDEAIAELQRGFELDPLSFSLNLNLAFVYYLARRYDQVSAQCHKLLELEPNFIPARMLLSEVYEQQQQYQQALAELRRVQELLGDESEIFEPLARLYAKLGRHIESLQTLKQMQTISKKRYVSPVDVAKVYLALGDREQFFAWLERAYAERTAWLVFLKGDPQFDSVRAEPRFIDLVRRIGLTP